MAKDYAKSTFKTLRLRKKQRARRILLLVILALLLSVTIPFGWVVYQGKFSGSGPSDGASWIDQIKTLLHRSNTTSVAQNKTVVSNVTEQEPEIHFDFYTELPKMQVALPATQDQLAKNTPAINTVPAAKPAAAAAPIEAVKMDDSTKIAVAVQNEVTNSKTEVKYVVQVGAYRNSSTASEMRISMLLAGFDADVVKTMLGNQVVYRIQQGPYRSLSGAKSAQMKLQAKGYEGVVQKIN